MSAESISAPASPPTRWPRVLGTLGIILGALSILDQLDDLVLMPMLRSPSSWNRLVGPDLGEEIVRWMPPPAWLTASALLGIALGALLLVGSLRLRRRRRSGASLTRTWAWLAIAWLVVEIATSWAWLARYAGELDDLSSAAWRVPAALGIVIAFALLAVYPIFLLIWFARTPIQSEVASWPADE
jgi:hypothetical protein